jgi:hypothetical protein
MTFILAVAFTFLARARSRLRRFLNSFPWEACGDRMLRLL